MEEKGPGKRTTGHDSHIDRPVEYSHSLPTSTDQVRKEEIIEGFVKMWFRQSLGASTRNP